MTSTQAKSNPTVLKLDISSKLTYKIMQNFACRYRPPNRKTSFMIYCRNSNKFLLFFVVYETFSGLVLVQHISTNWTNFRLKLDVCAMSSIAGNEDFL